MRETYTHVFPSVPYLHPCQAKDMGAAVPGCRQTFLAVAKNAKYCEVCGPVMQRRRNRKYEERKKVERRARG